MSRKLKKQRLVWFNFKFPHRKQIWITKLLYLIMLRWIVFWSRSSVYSTQHPPRPRWAWSISYCAELGAGGARGRALAAAAAAWVEGAGRRSRERTRWEEEDEYEEKYESAEISPKQLNVVIFWHLPFTACIMLILTYHLISCSKLIYRVGINPIWRSNKIVLFSLVQFWLQKLRNVMQGPKLLTNINY